ncbi:MAG: SdpI family protein, partial [Clostridia bacterium]|nr:SdpI family protein [Clostridia bacterium]
FIVLGNIMPKVKQNSYMGIKIKWTLESKENWFATHRMAGKVYVAIGLAFLVCALLPETVGIVMLLVGIIPAALAPVIYSYCYHKKQVAEGHVPKESENKKKPLKTVVISIITSLISVLIVVILLGGSITTEFGETSFTIKASPYEDFTVDYDKIDSIELIEEKDSAKRILGYGSPALSMGLFQNERFSRHTRYTYNNVHCYVAVRSGDAVLVVNAKSVEQTKQLYQDLLTKVNN